MTYTGVLFPTAESIALDESAAIPGFFVDLNLDQVVDAVVERKKEYDLKPIFYTPLRDVATINYRQDIFRDLENKDIYAAVNAFAEKMVLVRRYLKMIEKLYYKHHQQGWFLEAALIYCDAVKNLSGDLEGAPIKSKGLGDFLTYTRQYCSSAPFLSLQADSLARKTDLAAVQYNVIIKGNWVRVQKYDSEIDYSKEVEQTFEKFRQGEVKNYRIDLIISSGMNHVEAQILDCVARLYPDIFAALEAYYLRHTGFMDNVILTFDRQIQFFMAYLDFIENLKTKGYAFCYPEVTKVKSIHAQQTFDIALAHKRLFEPAPVVCNDFYLQGKERILVISGPNQGGKTTFARMFGQLHFLASLGCPVPGTQAVLFLYDRIFTHFEKEEDIRNLRGKLQDDLVRIHNILETATSDSIIIMNEIFTSTTLKDAVYLSKEIIERIIGLDALGVCVTFIDELSTLGEQTVSMVSTVVPENPSQRTFKILRMPADGLSYAIVIAEKHHLTYPLIKERILP